MEGMPGDFGEHEDFAAHEIGGFADHDGVSDFASDDHDGLGVAVFDTAPHDPADAIPTETHAEHTAHTEHTEHHAPVHHEPAREAAHYPRPGSHLEMDIYGVHYDTGQVDVDMNGDGHADTSVLHTVRDGVAQVEYYTDNDGDGHADELTITDDEGHLISHTQLDEHTGEWVETHLNHPLPSDLPDR